MTFGVHDRGTFGMEMSVEGSPRGARAVVYYILHATGFPFNVGLVFSPDGLRRTPSPFSIDYIQTFPASRPHEWTLVPQTLARPRALREGAKTEVYPNIALNIQSHDERSVQALTLTLGVSS